MTSRSEKGGSKKVEPVVPQPAIQEPEEVTSPVEEFLGRAEKAYSAYMEAQKQVFLAYKENELALEKVFKDIEVKAQKEFEKSMDQSLRQREEDDLKAEEEYRAAKDLIKKCYDGAVEQALQARQATISQAWDSRSKNLERAWKIFSR